MDTRAKRITITAPGAAVAERAVAEVELVDAETFGAEAAVIAPILQRLAKMAPPTLPSDRSALHSEVL